MRVILFGASGMVGSGVLHECLTDSRVTSVLSIVRRTTGAHHPKLEEIVHQDFFDYASLKSPFMARDACFFCLGVSSVGMKEPDYRRLTFDLTVAAAQAIVAASPRLTFCYVSGAGTDSSERGRSRWARVKGATENALLKLPFKAAFMFRPGYIQPLQGVRSRTALYQALYNAIAPLYPVLRRVFPRFVTTSVNIGRAMIAVAQNGYSKPILEVEDINRLASRFDARGTGAH